MRLKSGKLEMLWKAGKLQLKAGKLEMLWKAGKNKAGNAIESWKTKVINMYIFYQSNFMIFILKKIIYIYMDFKIFKKAGQPKSSI